MNSWFQFVSALAFLYMLLVLPDWPGNFVSYTFIRLPIELPLLMLMMVTMPLRAMRGVRALITAMFTIVIGLKFANLVTFEGYARPFNILVDPGLVSTAVRTIAGGQGMVAAVSVIVAVAALIAALAALLWWAIGALQTNHSPISPRAMVAIAGVALVCAVPLADVKFDRSWWNITSWDTSRFARERALSVLEGLRYDAAFRVELEAEVYSEVPDEHRLAALRGTDVLLIFVESYGRVALEEPSIATSVLPALEAFDAAIKKRGFAARSAWLTSPTFGGQSWLAHSTFATGLWVDNQRRYESLFVSERKTLVHDFALGGWRTVGVMPQITFAWPEGKLFGYDQIYAAADLDYAGPHFDYMTMPDQYTLSAFHARELMPSPRSAVMAEIGLISSHLPWTPLPKIVRWDDIRNGEIFSQARHPRVPINWTDTENMRANYAAAMIYEIQILQSYVAEMAGSSALLVIVGDHQPTPVVSGNEASYDVPVHIISGDPSLLDAINDWRWTPGMIPTASSPVWRMDAMRQRFLESFTPGTAQATVPINP